MHPHPSRIFIFCLSFFLFLTVMGTSAFAQYPGFDAPGNAMAGGGAAGLVPVEPTIDGGNIPVGASAQVVVRFRNDGGQPVQTGQINLYPSSTVSANVSLDQCSKEPLSPGAECAVAISVKGMQAGAWRLEMLMMHNGRTRLVTATLSGNVEASADSADKLSSDIETIPDKLDFGALSSSQTLVESVILRNITSNPVKISEVMIDANPQSGYSVKAECEELLAGEACIATVTWAPKQKGPSTGVLVIKHDGPTSVASVSLSGDYAPDAVAQAELFPEAVPGKGLLVSSQTEFGFGDAVGTASTITVSLVNTGDAPLTLKEIKLSGANNGLTLGADGCSPSLTLQPIEACPLTLTWSPTRIGSLLDDIQILHDGARGVLVLPVRGQSTGVVSQDQKAIVLSEAPTAVIRSDVMDEPQDRGSDSKPTASRSQSQNSVNAASALDGLRITSFASKRAIVNGPGGSRLVHDDEQIMLGGVLWNVDIQANGIEFSAGADRVLLIFDRSLSSINHVAAKSSLKSASEGQIKQGSDAAPAE